MTFLTTKQATSVYFRSKSFFTMATFTIDPWRRLDWTYETSSLYLQSQEKWGDNQITAQTKHIDRVREDLFEKCEDGLSGVSILIELRTMAPDSICFFQSQSELYSTRFLFLEWRARWPWKPDRSRNSQRGKETITPECHRWHQILSEANVSSRSNNESSVNKATFERIANVDPNISL